MRNFKKWNSLAALLLVASVQAHGQCQYVDVPDTVTQQGGGQQGGLLYESRNGQYLPTSNTLRILIVLVEQDNMGGSNEWPAQSLPIWVNNPDPNINLFDWNVPTGTATGLLTRYFQDASSGHFNVIADYLVPDNSAIFHTSGNTVSDAVAAVNSQASGILSGHDFTSASDFDMWETNTAATGQGLPKIPGSETGGVYDHVMFIWRTGGSNVGSAYHSSPGSILGHQANTYSIFYAHDGIPIDIMRHEFSHLLYGGNNFHTGGGGWAYSYGEYFITLANGWSNMGLANASLNSWNGWDRQRMGWYGVTSGSDNANLVSARDASNTAQENGDLDASVPGGAGIYTLRDFVSTGDAIRIKLPFTDPNTEYPEFLWVENHQGQALNGNPFDKWKFEPDPCIVSMLPGLQMYVQIDKEVRQASSYAPIYNGPGDHIRPLDANGHSDISFAGQTQLTNCICWQCPKFPFIRGLDNPLTGSADRHWVSQDLDADNALTVGDKRINEVENVQGSYSDNLIAQGHALQVFTPSGNHKVGVGTNPSSATMMNKVGYDNDITPNKNLRRIYLNGVSVELMQQNTDGSIQVRVRFDDVDVNNVNPNTRWCADEIQLNPVPTATGYSLNVTAGNTVTLDQGTTATRRDNPVTYNGQQIFVSPTLMRCPATTWLNLAPGSGFTVDHGSTLRLESGSRMDIGNGAVLRVKRGGKLELMGGSVLNVLPGGQVIIEEDWQVGNDGHLLFFPNARINLEASNSVLEIAGMLDIQANATFTTSRSGDPNTTYGLVKFTNTDAASYNVTAGANSRFILRSTNVNNRILHVEQESLYGPPQLLEFSLLTGTATLANNARIVPPVSNNASIRLADAIVTSSTGVRNNHRGVRLNGQAMVMLKNSTFMKGAYGVYSYNTTLGSSLSPESCSFIDCRIGMYNYDKGLKALGCKFNNCENGLVCEQMAVTSFLVDCTARHNNGAGVTFKGFTTLKVVNPAFDYNAVGLELSQATAILSCGSVSLNGKYGFLVTDGATVRMDAPSGGAHDPVTAVKNGTTIYCQLANNVYLDLGYNTLYPQYTGTQSALYGTFLCQPYSVPQPARKNNWDGTVGTPLTTADYSITICGVPLPFFDPSSISPVQCGNVMLLLPGVGTLPTEFSELGILENCPGCSMSLSADSLSVPLDQASLAAFNLGNNDSLPSNELLALTAFHSILSAPYAGSNTSENLLLNYDHDLMKESYGDALEKGQLASLSTDFFSDSYVDMFSSVQDARAARPDVDDDFIFYTNVERAQVQRAAGRMDEAISILEGLPEPVGEYEQTFKARILCYTQTEAAVHNGTMEWDEVENTMDACLGHGTPKMASAQTDAEPGILAAGTPYILPNPASSFVQVQGFMDQESNLIIMDVMSRSILKEIQFSGKTEVPLGSFSPGIYLCRIAGGNGGTWTGRLVIQR